MTLIIQKPTGAKLNLLKTWQPMDPDAATYITAVETADGQALEEKVKIAIDNFVLGCKADGIWSAIKASCILAGARTLAGALVPLKGTAPINFNFVAGDYSRKTGLGATSNATKYLDTNQSPSSVHATANNAHSAVYVTSLHSIVSKAFYGSATSSRILLTIPGTPRYTIGINDLGAGVNADLSFLPAYPGLLGLNRSTPGSFTFKYPGGSSAISRASGTPSISNYFIYRQNDNTTPAYSDHRIAFYSFGDAVDLEIVSARVTDLINAFGVAIP
jgi:hypothetical protein